MAFEGWMCTSDVSLSYKGYCASMTNCICQAGAVCVQMQWKFRTVVELTTVKVWEGPRSYLHKMKKGAHTTLYLPWKCRTNGATSHDKMQSTLKRTTYGTSKPPPPSDNAIPHKHSRRLQVPQNHPPHAARSIKTRPDSLTTSTLTQL